MTTAPQFKKYETVVVTKTDAGHEAQRKLYEKVTEMMEKAGAKHIRFELWGKRRLAFPIQKANKGLYMYYVYLADKDFVRELTRALRLSNIVLRYLTVKLADGLDPATYDYEKEKMFDNLPSEQDDADHRATTGWEGEFANRPDSASDEDEDEDEEGGEGRKDRDRDDEDEEE
jgi:small subunit ribosomal protein S6